MSKLLPLLDETWTEQLYSGFLIRAKADFASKSEIDDVRKEFIANQAKTTLKFESDCENLSADLG
jgi:hypothetical protein